MTKPLFYGKTFESRFYTINRSDYSNDGKFDDEHRDLLFGLYNAIADMCEDFRYNPENPCYYILPEDRDAIQKALQDPDLDKAIADGKFKLAVQEYDLDNKDMLGD